MENMTNNNENNMMAPKGNNEKKFDIKSAGIGAAAGVTGTLLVCWIKNKIAARKAAKAMAAAATQAQAQAEAAGK